MKARTMPPDFTFSRIALTGCSVGPGGDQPGRRRVRRGQASISDLSRVWPGWRQEGRRLGLVLNKAEISSPRD